jgi:NDP-sugar pyrophosphorylase family protein
MSAPGFLAGILAAGEGTRLRHGGLEVPKPLLRVGGRTLIERTLEQLEQAGAESVYVIVNEQSTEVRDYVKGLRLPLPVTFVIRSTPSSMHSLHVLRPFFEGRDALVSMVDSILPPGSLAEMARLAAARQSSIATLALTSYVDDEKPVSARLQGDRVLEVGTGLPGTPWVTAGIYYFRPPAWRELDAATTAGVEKMRNFLAHLVASGLPVHGHELPKTIDVDRPQDLGVAEAAVRTF